MHIEISLFLYLMQFSLACKGNVGDDVYHTFAGLSSEERAGNGPGLTRVHATVSTTSEEGRAGVGPGLMAIHAPISQPSIISMEDVTASESPTTELLAKNEELQGNSEDSKAHLFICSVDISRLVQQNTDDFPLIVLAYNMNNCFALVVHAWR